MLIVNCGTCRYEVVSVRTFPCSECNGNYSNWTAKYGGMTPNTYQEEALRTASSMNPNYPMFLNGVLGLAGESGECVDMIKKYLFQGHELDKEHLAKELGDVAWYLAVTAHAIGYDLETVLRMNVEKLRSRYPEGFDPEKSQHRKEGDV